MNYQIDYTGDSQICSSTTTTTSAATSSTEYQTGSEQEKQTGREEKTGSTGSRFSKGREKGRNLVEPDCTSGRPTVSAIYRMKKKMGRPSNSSTL